MTVPVKNFGEALLSRPAGREAFLLAKAYVFKTLSQSEEIILDFTGVKVLTPSWADEFITALKSQYKNTVSFFNTDNPSVSASLRAITT